MGAITTDTKAVVVIPDIVAYFIVGCIAGAIGLHVSRAWIIFSTAFWGGVLCVAGLLPILSVFCLVGILIIPAGIRYQLKTTGISLKKDTSGQAAPSPAQPQMVLNVELPKEPQEKVQSAGQDDAAAMFCGKCGNKIGADAAFCPKCGNRVR